MPRNEKPKTFYNKDGIQIEADSLNWILKIDNRITYWDTLSNLMLELLNENIKKEVKPEFENISRILTQIMQDIVCITEGVENQNFTLNLSKKGM